jgi:hypothetical protein
MSGKGTSGKKLGIEGYAQLLNYEFQAFVPTCDGVNPLFYVRWYQFEDDGKEVTISTDAMDTYIAISVFTGGCDLECVAADGQTEVTDTSHTTAEVAFETEEDVIYLVAVTTTWGEPFQMVIE